MNPVFKFGDADGAAKILANNTIFVTSPLDLNDPFEMRPAWTEDLARRDYERRLQRDLHITGLPIYTPTENGGIGFVGTKPAPEKREFVPPENEYGLADMHHTRAFGALAQNFRVLSFATEVFDPSERHADSRSHATLMWSHYGDQFQGICLVFDDSKLHHGLTEGGRMVDYDLDRAELPPDYYNDFTEARCQVDGLEFSAAGVAGILLPTFRRHEIYKERFIDLLTRKAGVWEYEKEKRFIYGYPELKKGEHYYKLQFACDTCKAAKRDLEDCKVPRYRDCLKFPSEAVVAVAFGSDINTHMMADVTEALRHPDYSHVKTYYTRIHPFDYRVRYVEDSIENIITLQRSWAAEFNASRGHEQYSPDGRHVYQPRKGTCIEPKR